jgi:RimJ/RimL family protein N-acetyltransferase
VTALETARLHLEPLLAAHADLLFAGLADARLYTYMPDRPPVSLDALRARYRRLESRRSPDGSEQWLNWIVFERASGRAVGYVQATVYAGAAAADVAYVLLRDAWGHGYAREATRAMIDALHAHDGVRHVRATVDVRNRASVRLLEALGFVRTAQATDEAAYRLELP